MAFEYIDRDGDVLRVDSITAENGGPHIALTIGNWEQGSLTTADVAVDADRVEELVAGIRDAARTASGQQPESCRPIDVDGTTILVRGSGDWTDEDQHHMAAIVAAAKRRYEAEHPACSCTHPQDRHLSACTECPCVGYAPTWPRTAAPAAGQPAEAQAADLLAACATEYQVPVPEGGGTTLQVRRQSLVHGMGWAVSTRAYGGGRAWTTEGWQESISALSVDRLFCWPDAATAVTEARRALATVEEDETR
jgi:hypothetical protein